MHHPEVPDMPLAAARPPEPQRAPRRRHWAAAFAALLGLVQPAAAQDTIAQSGPFAIEPVHKRSGLQFSANVGFTRVGYVQRRVLYRGRPLALRDDSGRRLTDVHDAWVLADAPEPAVLVGGAHWTIVTERNGQPHLQPLPVAANGLLFWADASGTFRRIEAGRVRLDASDEAVLQGGRWLLFEDKALLDLQTLRVQALAPAVPSGYTPAEPRVLGVSPDQRALVLLYRGASNSPRDSLLVVLGTQHGEQALLPVDMKAFMRGHLSEWAVLEQYGRWEPRGAGLPALALQPPASDTAWHTRYLYGLGAPRDAQGRTLARFELQPVRPSMVEALHDHLTRECGCELAWVEPEPQRKRVFEYRAPTVTAVVRFDAERRALVIEAPNEPSPLWAQAVTARLGDLLDEQLRDGRLHEHLALPRPAEPDTPRAQTPPRGGHAR